MEEEVIVPTAYDQSLAYLQSKLVEGSKVYTIFEAPMYESNKIKILIIDEGQIRDVTTHVANVLDLNRDNKNCVECFEIESSMMEGGNKIIQDLSELLFGSRESLLINWL